MENVYLNQLAKQGIDSVRAVSLQQDRNKPLTFLDWKLQRIGYPEENTYYFYQQYLIDWFQTNKQISVSTDFTIRQKYLYLLQQLQTFFTDAEKQSWYNKINYANEKELLVAIPFFAKKLKTIALYYLKLRTKLKDSKLKYNRVGTSAGLAQDVKTYLLETFSSLNTELEPEFKLTLPNFDDVKGELEVSTEELYDDFSYFDKSPSIDSETYFDLFNNVTAEFFRTKGIELSSDTWIFKALETLPLSGYQSYVTELAESTSNIFEITDEETYQTLLERLIGENKILTTFTSSSAVTNLVDMPLVSGNNYFYYPYGSYDASLVNRRVLLESPLSSANIEGATAGNTLVDCDVMFFKTGNLVKGAWLKKVDFEKSNQILKARIKEEGNTVFIFPFPGFGLSAENVEWTGYSLSATDGYQFLSKDLRSSINEVYWTSPLPQDSCDGLYLYNTTLIQDGATADINPNFADKLYIHNERPANEDIPFENVNGSWLYKFKKTSVPIFSQSDVKTLSSFIWPLQYVSTDEPLPQHLAEYNFDSLCDPIKVQDLDNPLAIAGTTFETADKIYKIPTHPSSPLSATECCWLSGSLQTNELNAWCAQEGISLLCKQVEPTTFIWTGPNNIPVSRVFGSVEHETNCNYISPLQTETLNASACNCKQVYYSPFGHPADSFFANNSKADYIIEDNYTTPDTPYDFKSVLSKTTRFAWFRTFEKTGWGYGSWVYGLNGERAPFTLQKGKKYTYVRSQHPSAKAMPDYVVNYRFPLQTSKPIWIQAKKNKDNDWISTGIPANTIIYPGDLIYWDRRNLTTAYYLSSYEVVNETKSLSSIWCNYDFIALNQGTMSQTDIHWPFNITTTDEPNSQIPTFSNNGTPVRAQDVESIIRWTITNKTLQQQKPYEKSTYTIYDSPYVTFVPPTSGIYAIEVEAIIRTSDTTTAVVLFSSIPPITVVPETSFAYEYIPVTHPSSGYLLEQTLNGWNYGTDEEAEYGARPYWSTLDINKTEATKFKGLYSWGYPNAFIDNQYLPDFAPRLSPLRLEYGNVVNYERKGQTFNWFNPLVFYSYVGKTQWCTLSSTFANNSTLSAFYGIKQNAEPTVYALDTPTDIKLTNFANGYPVEIFYYALNAFTWQISATTLQLSSESISNILLQSKAPQQTLSNRFYPTIATIPVAEQIYSLEDYGGYLTPQYLGASQYINENFTPVLKKAYFNTELVSEDITEHIGGRGLTKQDQPTVYKWEENNQWLKEPPTSKSLAGAVRKNATKRYQTFIPYKNSNEKLGLILPTSRLTPWGGAKSTDWTDFDNEPISYTGVRNLSAWNDSQLLKQTEREMENWCTDVYGNQYGLYKEYSNENETIENKRAATGQLWVRTNKQRVLPATQALSSLYNFFDTEITQTIYNELIGDGIKSVDCFFETLYIKTPSAVILARVNQNYEADTIETTYDDVRIKKLDSLEIVGDTWFDVDTKHIYIPFISLSSTIPNIQIWDYDISRLPDAVLKQIFPIPSKIEQQQYLIQSLSSLNINSFNSCLTNWNKAQQKMLLTITGNTVQNAPFVFDLTFKRKDGLNLTEVATFSSTNLPQAPVAVDTSLSVETNVVPFSTTLFSTNSPLTYTLLNYNEIASLTNNGVLTLSATLPGIYHLNYEVANEAGSNQFCASVFVNIPQPTLMPTQTPRPTRTPTPSPSPSKTPTPSPSPTNTATLTPTPSLRLPTPTPTSSGTATPLPTTTLPPTPFATATPNATPNATPASTPTVTPTNTDPTPTPTTTAATATPTHTPTRTPTRTPDPTATPTTTPSSTPAPTPSRTPSPTASGTPGPTPTRTFEPTRTPSPTQTPTNTSPTGTPPPTPQPTPSRTPSPTASATSTPPPPTPTTPPPTGTPVPTSGPVPGIPGWPHIMIPVVVPSGGAEVAKGEVTISVLEENAGDIFYLKVVDGEEGKDPSPNSAVFVNNIDGPFGLIYFPSTLPSDARAIGYRRAGVGNVADGPEKTGVIANDALITFNF